VVKRKRRKVNKMPYNIDSKQGGDSPENDTWMEGCVNSIEGKNKKTGQPYTKGEKIAICKTQLKKKKESKSELDFILDEEVISTFNKYREKYLRDTKAALNVDERTAIGMFEVHLARRNFEFP
jgi:hypothetical protein